MKRGKIRQGPGLGWIGRSGRRESGRALDRLFAVFAVCSSDTLSVTHQGKFPLFSYKYPLAQLLSPPRPLSSFLALRPFSLSSLHTLMAAIHNILNANIGRLEFGGFIAWLLWAVFHINFDTRRSSRG